MSSIPDSIERTVLVAAEVEHVWELVSEPGWWVNTGTITEHEITWEDDVASVTDPALGTFHIRRVEERAPEYVAFRWAAGTSEAPTAGDPALDTLCEFFVRPTAKGVEVRVVESGWAALGDTERVRTNHAENAEGWTAEMAALQQELAAA